MLALALDTSTPRLAVAVVDVAGDGAVEARAAYVEAAGNRHGELLAPVISQALATSGAGVGDLGAIVCGVGPGPFTGLRVGVVTAASMADALGVPAYGVCSLDAVARPHAGQPLLVVTDARRKQVYWARYRVDGTRVAGPDIATPAEVASRHAGSDVTVVGPGLESWRDAFDGLPTGSTDGPAATDLVRLASGRIVDRDEGDVLAPMYLRRPDAVPPAGVKRVTPA